MVIFGGTDGKSLFSDVHFLDTETFTWSKPNITGSIPPRSSAAVCLIENRMYVFGGSGQDEIFAEVHVLQLDELKWYACDLETLGIGPGTVAGGAFALMGDSQLYCVGGDNVTQMYVLETSKIEFIPLTGSAATSTSSDTSPLTKKKLLLVEEQVLLLHQHLLYKTHLRKANHNRNHNHNHK